MIPRTKGSKFATELIGIFCPRKPDRFPTTNFQARTVSLREGNGDCNPMVEGINKIIFKKIIRKVAK